MKLLLDTHTLLWWFLADPQISPAAKALMTDVSNDLYFSAAGVLEVTIKAQIGKLALPTQPRDFFSHHLPLNGIQILPISCEPAVAVGDLPLLHRDPFDRILVAQSTVESMPIITADPLIQSYGVATYW